jgi:hypothetical protein
MRLPLAGWLTASRRRAALVALLVAGVVALVVQVVLARAEARAADAEAIAFGQAQLDKVCDQLRERLSATEGMARALASDLETGELAAGGLLARLERDSRKHPYLLGFTAAFEPFAYDPGKRLYAPFYDSANGKVIQCEDYYDYTDPANDRAAAWYLRPAREKTPAWVVAYGPAAGSTYAGYSVPFFARTPDGKPGALRGVVNVAISLQAFSDLLNTRFVGRLGTAWMVDRKGVLVAHAVDEHLKAGRTLRDILEEDGCTEDALRMARDLAGGGTGSFRFRDQLGFRPPQSGWVFYRPVELADWSVGVAMFEGELYRNEAAVRRRAIWIALTALLCLTLLPLSFVRSDRFDVPRIVVSILTFTVCGALTVCYVWTLALRGGPRPDPDGPRERTIDDLRGLDAFLDERRQRAQAVRAPPPATVPTRILVRTLAFEGSHDVQVSGHVWQTYRVGDGLTRGITFPDATPDAESVAIEESFREVDEDAGIEVRGWKFRITLRQNFDFLDFPFDAQTVVITVKHVDEARNVLLVPDLARYRFLNSSAQPGVHGEMSVPGWERRGSYFRYRLTRYDVEYGMPGKSDLGDFPELGFNVVLRRRFLTPFISYVVPVLIVAMLLYGVIVLSSVQLEKQSASGFNIFGVLGTCGAFFFTIALLHIDLRGQINASVVTYLESLYVVTYALLVLVSLNALLFIAGDAVPFIEYRDNVIAKLLFWPLFIGLVLGVTVVTFY